MTASSISPSASSGCSSTQTSASSTLPTTRANSALLIDDINGGTLGHLSTSDGSRYNDPQHRYARIIEVLDAALELVKENDLAGCYHVEDVQDTNFGDQSDE